MNNKQTGAKISTKFVALTIAAVIGVGSIGVGTINCNNNNPTTDLCLTAKVEQMVMGYDAALKHEANDLKKAGAVDIVYEPNPTTIVVIPEGYIYEDGMAARYLEPKKDKEIPEGFELVDYKGEQLIRKVVRPELKIVGPSVSYKIEEDGITYANRIYWNEETKTFETISMAISLGDKDVVTYCNPNIIADDYVYVIDRHGKSVPVRYSESEKLPEDGTIDETYQAEDLNYEFARVVTFYTDDTSLQDLSNKYAVHLNHGDVLILVDQSNGKTTFAVYSKVMKSVKTK
jgi:hypothetical protein